MPKIEKEHLVNGFEEKVKRLGLDVLVLEVKDIVTGFDFRISEVKDGNSSKALRQLIDERFKQRGGWSNKQTKDIDWTKCKIINGTQVCLGVEIQVSTRSEMISIDFVHLRNAMVKGSIDAGMIVVPSDRMSNFLTDRVVDFSTALKYIHEMRVEDLPFAILSIEHDGTGPALPKQKKG